LKRVAVLAIPALVATLRPARADEIDACKAAAEEAETLRSEAHLRAARERLLACARDACPRVIRTSCTLAFADLERITPTIVLRARDRRGRDVLGVRVLLDGAPLVTHLTGTAVAVDPGPHRLRYEAASGDAYEETVLVAQGERDRVIPIVFTTALEPDGTVASSAPPAAAHDAREESGPSLVPPAIAVGVGVVGIGVFSVLDLQAWSDFRALRDGPCAASRTCDTGGVRTKLYVADVALAVGIISLGVAAVLTLPHLGGHGKSTARR
jgi:hypothetical protein